MIRKYTSVKIRTSRMVAVTKKDMRQILAFELSCFAIVGRRVVSFPQVEMRVRSNNGERGSCQLLSANGHIL